MELFKNKYRIASARLQTWDYGNCAAYFITICTANREHYFGEIENGKMLLSEIGIITEDEWKKSVQIRPDMNLSIGDFVVMPNHFHAIIGIGQNEYNKKNMGDVMESNGQNRFGPQSKNLASIIRGFKSAVTTYARKNNILFNWQPLYHDHIIRDESEYQRIANYIQNNIAQWEKDKFYKNKQ